MGILLECGWRERLHHQSGQRTLSELQLLSQGRYKGELEEAKELSWWMAELLEERKINVSYSGSCALIQVVLLPAFSNHI